MTVNRERMTADIDGEFVVFLIGMRINRLWKVHKWLPIFTAMPRMLKELERNPESGLLGYERHLGIRNLMVVQYWRSFEQLRDYAWNPAAEHVPAIGHFFQDVGFNGDVGIWHETFLVESGQYEAVYGNMPPYGLGAAADLVPALGRRRTAAGRLGLTEGDDTPMVEEGTVTGENYVKSIEF